LKISLGLISVYVQDTSRVRNCVSSLRALALDARDAPPDFHR